MQPMENLIQIFEVVPSAQFGFMMIDKKLNGKMMDKMNGLRMKRPTGLQMDGLKMVGTTRRGMHGTPMDGGLNLQLHPELPLRLWEMVQHLLMLVDLKPIQLKKYDLQKPTPLRWRPTRL